MRRKSSKQRKMERDNREWRRGLVLEVGRCQMPDCPGEWPRELCVNEIGRGIHRSASYSERLACNVVCVHCNEHRCTDYALWPLERQVANQILCCAEIATPQEVIDAINRVRGRGPNAITWADCARHLAVIA